MLVVGLRKGRLETRSPAYNTSLLLVLVTALEPPRANLCQPPPSVYSFTSASSLSTRRELDDAMANHSCPSRLGKAKRYGGPSTSESNNGREMWLASGNADRHTAPRSHTLTSLAFNEDAFIDGEGVDLPTSFHFSSSLKAVVLYPNIHPDTSQSG